MKIREYENILLISLKHLINDLISVQGKKGNSHSWRTQASNQTKLYASESKQKTSLYTIIMFIDSASLFFPFFIIHFYVSLYFIKKQETHKKYRIVGKNVEKIETIVINAFHFSHKNTRYEIGEITLRQR